jgi:hypothetical protein
MTTVPSGERAGELRQLGSRADDIKRAGADEGKSVVFKITKNEVKACYESLNELFTCLGQVSPGN